MNRPFSWKRFLPEIKGVSWYKCKSCHGYFLLMSGDSRCPLCGGELQKVNGAL